MLSDKQIADVVNRWLAGEELRDIVRDFEGMGYHTLLNLTKEARRQTEKYRKHSPLTLEQIDHIAERWAKGEQLKAIMKDYPGIGLPLFAKVTRDARKAKTPQFSQGPLPALKPDQIEEAVHRWQAGESLAMIARDYGVEKGVLAQATRSARHGLHVDPATKRRLTSQRLTFGPRSHSHLRPEQLANIVTRWEAGEEMRQIARDYDDISYYWLIKITRKARMEKDARGKVAEFSSEHLLNAIERWDNGEPLKHIAQDFKTSEATLRKYMEKLSGQSFKRRKPRRRPSKSTQLLLSDAQFSEALARWHAGEALYKIAASYGISKTNLSNITRTARGVGPRKFNLLSDEQQADVVSRWKAGEPLTSIAASYGMSTTTLTRISRSIREAAPRHIYELSDSQLAEAKTHREAGEHLKEIAARYNVSVGALTRKMHEKYGKIPTRNVSLPDEQIADVVARWKVGESLKNIALGYNIHAETLAAKTREARTNIVRDKIPRPTPPPRQSKPSLTEEQIHIAVARWEKGEKLDHIARALGIHVNTLSKHTKEARSLIQVRQRAGYLTTTQIVEAQMRLLSGETLEAVAAAFPIANIIDKLKQIQTIGHPKLPLLTFEQIAQAIERWKNGETLKNISKSLSVSPDTLSKYTWEEREKIKNEMPVQLSQKRRDAFQEQRSMRPPLMTHEQINDAVERWKNGATLDQIAHDYQISVHILAKYTKAARNRVHIRRKLIKITSEHIDETMVRWRNGERLHDIARTLNVSFITLGKLTKAARAQEKKPPGWYAGLVGDRLAIAIDRWKAGEQLHKIASDMGVSYFKLYELTAEARAVYAQRKQYAPITQELVSAALTRWSQGESMLDIAKAWNVSGNDLYKQTQDGRRSLGQTMKAISLSTKQLDDILSRWQGGESLHNIARSYQMNYHALCEATKGLRSRDLSGAKLNEEQLQEAIRRWRNGESMAEIARSYNASYSALLMDTRPLRIALEEAKPTVRLHLLDSEEIADTLARWKEGQSVDDIARHYRMVKEKIIETLIFERWRRGDPLKQVAYDFHKGRAAARKIIVTYKELYSAKTADKSQSVN